MSLQLHRVARGVFYRLPLVGQAQFGIQFRIVVSGARSIMARRAIELTCHTNPALNVTIHEQLV